VNDEHSMLGLYVDDLREWILSKLFVNAEAIGMSILHTWMQMCMQARKHASTQARKHASITCG
jgi:hypothetical protein